jgi:carboxypeptidase C (cathepsin A)
MCNDHAQLCRSTLTRVAPLISRLQFSMAAAASALTFFCVPALSQSATPDGALATSIVETRHSLIVEGTELNYTANAGTLLVRLGEAGAGATMFYISYRKEGEDAAARPITFVFNGGPGASAAWLHLGALGPQRVALGDDGKVPAAPARLVDNAQTWLRFTDLVFIDPVGTGFSREQPREKEDSGRAKHPFWGIESDMRSLAEFMRLYLTRNDRWASPKFLAGESYGGFRVAALAETLPAEFGIDLSGAVLISPVIEYTLNLGNDYLTLMPWVTLVPSYAATAFHYSKSGGAGRDLNEVTAEAEAFSRRELLIALASGAPRGSEDEVRVFAHLAAITGLPMRVVQRYRGRVTAEVFAKRLLEDSGRIVGIFDGSVSGPDPEPLSLGYPPHDPSFFTLVAPVVSAFNAYVRDALNYRTDLRYELINAEVLRAWNWTEGGSPELPGVGQRLRNALSLNPNLKVLIAHGYFDLATPYFASKYVVERLELDEAVFPNLQLRVYAGGHMFYTHTNAREQLYLDAEALYKPAVPPAATTQPR